MARKRLMITMDEDLLVRLEQACKSQGVSKSAYISMVVAKDMEDSAKLLSEFRNFLDQALKDSGLEQPE